MHDKPILSRTLLMGFTGLQQRLKFVPPPPVTRLAASHQGHRVSG